MIQVARYFTLPRVVTEWRSTGGCDGSQLRLRLRLLLLDWISNITNLSLVVLLFYLLCSCIVFVAIEVPASHSPTSYDSRKKKPSFALFLSLEVGLLMEFYLFF